MEYFWAFTVVIVSLISGNEGDQQFTTNWEVSECSKSCGGGTQTLSVTQMCNLHECQGPCTAGLDIGIILDKSASVKQEPLKTVIKFLTELVKQFNPSPKGDHFGLITFNNKPSLVFDFNNSKYQGKSALVAKIKSENGGLGSKTYIIKALEMADNELFSKAGGDREDKPNVLLVLTDGEPFWGHHPKHGGKLPSDEKFEEIVSKINENFKAKKVHVVVIGFGPKAQEMGDTLRVIAGPEGDVIKEPDVKKLSSDIQKIKTALCSSTFT